MARNLNYKYSKYNKDALLIDSVVTKIEEKNITVKDRIKNVFYLKSSQYPEGRLCILWGYSTMEVGDKVSAKGRITDDGTFLAWSVQVNKNKKLKIENGK